MSKSFFISGNSATLTAEFSSPIYLDENTNYVIGLVNFKTFKAILKIDKSNNLMIHDKNTIIVILLGSYELEDINKYVQNHYSKDRINISIFENNNTLHLKSLVSISFEDGTIGKLFGFKDKWSESNVAEIIKVNSINVDCSNAEEAYLNGKSVNIIDQFFPM